MSVLTSHAFLIELAEQDPDITLCELRDALWAAHGLWVYHSAIGYALPTLSGHGVHRPSLRV